MRSPLARLGSESLRQLAATVVVVVMITDHDQISESLGGQNAATVAALDATSAVAAIAATTRSATISGFVRSIASINLGRRVDVRASLNVAI